MLKKSDWLLGYRGEIPSNHISSLDINLLLNITILVWFWSTVTAHEHVLEVEYF